MLDSTAASFASGAPSSAFTTDPRVISRFPSFAALAVFMTCDLKGFAVSLWHC
jgi:hypothetical protein